jgi:CRP/FNR family transcriptional regulator, cyclic AMP receptor protein
MHRADIDSIPLFESLSPDEQARVAAAARPIHFEAGEVILHEGEFSFDFYAITSGAAEVRHGDEHVADLGAGDVLGEMGVVPMSVATRGWSRRRGATVVVTAPTDAIAIPGDEFRRMTEQIPALADGLRTIVSSRAAADE